jgi:hypothetical protein
MGLFALRCKVRLLSEYFLRTDPELARAIQESAWRSFFAALEETTPEFMNRLKERPFESFRVLADGYVKVSDYPFGAITCQVDGHLALNVYPLRDLALFICSPTVQAPSVTWPPSAAFWEPTMQSTVLKFAASVREWAAGFLDTARNPHPRIVGTALETMRAWLADPKSIESTHWLGHATIIRRSSLQTPGFEIPIEGWNPTKETEAQFRDRIKTVIKELKEWSRTHISEVKPHFVKYDTKRNSDHYCWTALRLAREMTYPQIAELWSATTLDGTDLDDGTVRKGVRAVLKRLGLHDRK